MHTDCIDVRRLTKAVCDHVVCQTGDSRAAGAGGPAGGAPRPPLLCRPPERLLRRDWGSAAPSLPPDVCLSFGSNEREFAYRCLYKYIL